MIVTELTANDTDLVRIFRDAESEMSRTVEDLRFRVAKSNVRNGIRWSSYHSYLRPSFHRSNLHIAHGCRVRRVHFYDGKAAAVSVSSAAGENMRKAQHLFARHEIIISAGAYQTPQLLKLSGIGPAAELREHKIRVLHDSPNVGTNLYDHMHLPLYVSINVSASMTLEKLFSASTVWQYLWHGSGLLSRFGVIGFVSDGDAGVGLFGVGSIDEKGMRDVSNYFKEVCEMKFEM